MPHRRVPEVLGRNGSSPRSGSQRGFLLALAALALTACVASSFGTDGIFHVLELRRQRRALSDRAFSLLQRNEALRKQILRFRDDDRHLETLAREKLGLVGEREVVYRFPAPAPAGRPSSPRP